MRASCTRNSATTCLKHRKRKRDKEKEFGEKLLSHDLLVHSICKINSLTFIATNESKTT